MDNDKIRQYFIDFQEREIETYPRDLDIKPSREFIVSVIGARRVGKTSLLLNLIKGLEDRKEAFYVDFENPEFMDFDGNNLKDLLDLHQQLFGKLKYIFLDEIQSVKNWEKGLRGIHENKRYFIFITGSSAKLLSQELATQLRGRTVSYQLYPLSFTEYLRFKHVDVAKKLLSSGNKNKILYEFNNYIATGGYPQIIQETALRDLIVRDYKDLVLFRDLVERYNLKNIYIVRRFFEYLISSFSKEISLDKFYNFLKSQNVSLSKKTLYNYLEYFESSLFFHFLRSYKVRERIKKVYLNDAVFGGQDKGRRLENLVCLELLRKTDKVYFFKGDNECDFVLPGKTAIQVTWELNSENEKRELKGLNEAMEFHHLKKGIILTYDQNKTIKNGKHAVQVVPVWQWCLHPAL